MKTPPLKYCGLRVFYDWHTLHITGSNWRKDICWEDSSDLIKMLIDVVYFSVTVFMVNVLS